jgi:type VI secretion system protein ImpG
VRDELLWYYERELGYLRRLGADYARRYPKIAGRLQLEPTKCEDPHVERLLEGFAFLAARIHLKLEDDFPDVAESMLSLLAPQLVRPVPSLSVAEFVPDAERGVPPGGFAIPRGAALSTRAVGQVHCAFRTAYDVTLWPLTVRDARWVAPEALDPPVRAGEALGALRLELRVTGGVALEAIPLDALRCYLHAEGGLAATLYELLCNACTAVHNSS